jgi:hypothetical protein
MAVTYVLLQATEHFKNNNNNNNNNNNVGI